ncbi:MAG: NYN domain-containing protein [Calditrichia bacterium]
MNNTSRVGVFVDVENIRRNGGYGMRFDVLRTFACRDGAEPIRLNAYVGFDKRRAMRDKQYNTNIINWFSKIRDFGFKVIEKEVKWFVDEEGVEYAKANADLDLAVDALLQSENCDRVLLVSGDGDFVQVVRALQNKGCRVEVLNFDNASRELRREADMAISGYLIPNLVQLKNGKDWGELGSRVRGTCYYYKHDENFGFMTYLCELEKLWITDAREEESPYRTAYFNGSAVENLLRMSDLPSRDIIFEFDLQKSAQKRDGMVAENITLISR